MCAGASARGGGVTARTGQPTDSYRLHRPLAECVYFRWPSDTADQVTNILLAGEMITLSHLLLKSNVYWANIERV